MNIPTIAEQQAEIARTWGNKRSNPHRTFSALQRIDYRFTTERKAKVADSSEWSLDAHQRAIWNQALDEAEANINILSQLYGLEMGKGNKAAAQIHYDKAVEWWNYGKRIEAATPAEFYPYYLATEMGLTGERIETVNPHYRKAKTRRFVRVY